MPEVLKLSYHLDVIIVLICITITPISTINSRNKRDTKINNMAESMNWGYRYSPPDSMQEIEMMLRPHSPPKLVLLNGDHLQTPFMLRLEPKSNTEFSGGPVRLAQEPHHVIESKGIEYNYPPRPPLPLPSCFYNPTGYVCCNLMLNNLMEETYKTLLSEPRFHNCNLNVIARRIQFVAEKTFNQTFETVVGIVDFAQKLHFAADLVCKAELGGRHVLAYSTAKSSDKRLAPSYTYGPKVENKLTQYAYPASKNINQHYQHRS